MVFIQETRNANVASKSSKPSGKVPFPTQGTSPGSGHLAGHRPPAPHENIVCEQVQFLFSFLLRFQSLHLAFSFLAFGAVWDV